jgi:16S rRNA (uracil1498-N3)-methyltransferase
MPLPRTDRRAQHVLEVLRRGVGDAFDAGIINGDRGKATVTAITDATLTVSFVATTPPSPGSPITLLVGLPRPQTARDILRDATTLGVAAIHFVRTEKGESSYAQSMLWTKGEWRRHVIIGAEQAFDTHVPEITHDRTLSEVMSALSAEARIALDNYESASPLSAAKFGPGETVALAIGAERGWSATERETLRANGFVLAHLGSRVLRAETAVAAAISIVRAKLGLM